MIRSRKPDRLTTLQAVLANQDILNRVVERMTEVEDISNVRRRNYYRIGVFTGIDVAMEIAFVKPVLVEAILNLFRVVGAALFPLFVCILAHGDFL